MRLRPTGIKDTTYLARVRASCASLLFYRIPSKEETILFVPIWTLTGSQTFYHFHAPSWQEQLELAGALSQLARRLRVISLIF